MRITKYFRKKEKEPELEREHLERELYNTELKPIEFQDRFKNLPEGLHTITSVGIRAYCRDPFKEED